MAATEPPSARRIREAREQGKVPRSEALAPGVLSGAVLVVLAVRGAELWRALATWFGTQLGAVAQPQRAASLALDALQAPLGPLGATLVTALALVLLVQRLQVGFVWAHRAPAGPASPWLRGWLTGLLSSLVVLAALALAMVDARAVLWLAPLQPPGALGGLSAFAWTVALGGALVVAVDVVRSRAAYWSALRVPRHEAERERRESEGPYAIRRQQRRLLRRSAGRAR